MPRTVLTIVIELMLSVLLALLLAGGYRSLIGSPAAEAFLAEAPRLILIFMDIGILTWLVLVIVGAVRKRGIGWGFGGSVLAAVIGAVMNLVWVAVLSLANGGPDIAAIALGVEAGILFIIAVALAALLVRRVILKPRPA